jgi:hypothetical protein
VVTVEILFAKALEAETIYKDRFARFGVGTYDKARNDARREMEEALFCAEQMELTGIAEVQSFGPFGLQAIDRGTRVRLMANAKVRTTHPKYRGKGYENPRARTVEVFDVHKGYANPDDHRRDSSLRHAEIVWVGTGGYWFYASINDVELIN